MKNSKTIILSLVLVSVVLATLAIGLLRQNQHLRLAIFQAAGEAAARSEKILNVENTRIEEDSMLYVELKQKIGQLEETVGRLEHLAFQQKNISMKSMKITGYTVDNQITLMTEDMERNTAATYILPEECKIYLVGQFGLAEVEKQILLEKIGIEIKDQLYDEYTFVFIDHRLVQIYQGKIQ